MIWQSLEHNHPELAAFGAARLNGNVAYLATVYNDGAPRVHPVTPNHRAASKLRTALQQEGVL